MTYLYTTPIYTHTHTPLRVTFEMVADMPAALRTKVGGVWCGVCGVVCGVVWW